MTKPKGKHGGKRAGAGRPPKLRAPPIGPIDPRAVLHAIAGDALQPASARVAAAKALLVAGRKPDDDGMVRTRDLAQRTLEILNRGRPN